MIGLRLDVKKMFFDIERIEKGLARETDRALVVFGRLVRSEARKSIRTHRRGHAKPGKPPYNKTGLLKKFIYFARDKSETSVVIGPVVLSGMTGKVPSVLEYGGTSLIKFSGGKRENVVIPAHPYMRPAFDKISQATLPGIFQNTLR